MAPTRDTDSTRRGEDVAPQEVSLTAGGRAGGAATGGQRVVSYQSDVLSPQDPATTLLGIDPKLLQTYVHTKPAHGRLQQLYS